MLEKIIPNLAVARLDRSIEFYRRVLGFEVVFVIGKERGVVDDFAQGAFAMLARDEQNLMLQTVESLAGELPLFEGTRPTPGGTVYFRGIDPEDAKARAESSEIVKGPFQQWYDMREIYLRDPDGHILCAGMPCESATV
ncbi:MAG: VOC family protein [Albidovulum sp.]|nr:VOC family protein [Albidovulum sp.]